PPLHHAQVRLGAPHHVRQPLQRQPPLPTPGRYHLPHEPRRGLPPRHSTPSFTHLHRRTRLRGICVPTQTYTLRSVQTQDTKELDVHRVVNSRLQPVCTGGSRWNRSPRGRCRCARTPPPTAESKSAAASPTPPAS